MYVELYGKAQDQSVPDKVRLKLKPLSRSYFRIGDQIKDFHQPIASWKYLHFDRFKITNKDKCRQEKEHGRGEWLDIFWIIILVMVIQTTENVPGTMPIVFNHLTLRDG